MYLKMNKFTKLTPLFLATSLVWGSQSMAEDTFTDWATVTQVTPIERQYTIRKPVEKCWKETVRVERQGKSDGSITNELIGGILGGVVGNQFGGGHGKDAMTIAGAALGASIANDHERYPTQSAGRYKEGERCETIYETEEKTEISHYRVSYRYNGQSFTTKMGYRPDESIRVKVSVSPARSR